MTYKQISKNEKDNKYVNITSYIQNTKKPRYDEICNSFY